MVKQISALFIGLAILFIGLFVINLRLQLPSGATFSELFLPTENLDLLLLQSYILPRIVIALFAGGILGLASLLLQQVMANPLASDNTLGISSGAQFALFLTAIFLPDWLENGSSAVALAGAILSLILVLSLAMRKTMSPLLLILAGLVVNLYFGSFSALMMLFYPEEARGLAQWGAGSLVQESWRDSLLLMAQSLPALCLIGVFIRPLTMLVLNDANAQSLGVPVAKLRVVGVLIAAFLIAVVVAKVGMLGFIGLASATIVRQLNIRRFSIQLVAAFAMGALLLANTDLLLQLLVYFSGINLPTGAVVALLGTPLLLWLMFSALPQTGRLQEADSQKIHQFRPLVLALILAGLLLAICLSLLLGNSGNGWHWAQQSELIALRMPRMMVALAVGILLAVAGVILQRLTLNPTASPELLGVSSGTSMGILIMLFMFSVQQTEWFYLAGIIGACVALVILTAINQRSGMLPEKVLLTGISLSALFDTLQRLAIASGDPRANQLISWTSGSTQNVANEFAVGLLAVSFLLLFASLVFSRWLAILVLQAPMAQALGLNLKQVRGWLIFFSALLTALATLVIGPLSFIGLLVPQITRFLGVRKVVPQIFISACLGGLIMTLADWLGRQLLFPYEIPAGLVATLVGGTYFLCIVRRV
ncbi:Fe(3+)-hydroxamate ABC transporter permease FhuB [Actinobacillus vicugnae]|uniref:Fe(3+)-hydroxamate ABC transporter permease FhuB n=1 Tax=Actinobacillus vicugnae TaxID=2573093 RepID=UPI001241017A|nr:Fe(3+)-hydroxamate ABC transporter permease FhuB [Actinobacillus vicugnae]